MKTAKKFFVHFFLIFTTLLTAQTQIWTGSGGDADWFNPSNWNTELVPTANSDVLISDGFNVEILTNQAAVNSLQLEGTSNLFIHADIVISSNINIGSLATLTFDSGILSGGIVENNGLLKFEGFFLRTFDNVIINNAANILITETGLTKLLNTTLNNLTNGVIEIPSNGGFSDQNTFSTINNEGIIRKSSNGSANGSFYLININNTGTIEVIEDQTFLILGSSLDFNNLESGRMVGAGAYDITANFTNEGVVFPGQINTVGTMTIVNVFSLNNGVLEIDIIGNQEGEYDVINVFGNPDMSGFIQVNLQYAPQIDEVFTILTANFNIVNCNFPTETTATFNGFEYSFQINCNSNNIQLRVSEINALGINANVIDEGSFFSQPNPTNDIAHFIFTSEIFILPNNSKVSIYNYLGQKVTTINDFSKENNSFKRGELANGLYFAHLEADGNVIATTKLILK